MVIIKDNSIEQSEDGVACWDKLIDEYERHNKHHKEETKDKMRAIRLVDYTHKQHSNFHDVEDMFNSLTLLKIKLAEAGGTWTDDDQEELLRKSFESTQRSRDEYARIIREFERRGDVITPAIIENEMREWYRSTVPKDVSNQSNASALNTASGRDNNDITCIHCGKIGHRTAKSPECPKHDPARVKHTEKDKRKSNEAATYRGTDQAAEARLGR